jgi:hypothetical protein
MPLPSFPLILLVVFAAFEVLPSRAGPSLQLSHKELTPGFGGDDFETSARIHEWTKVRARAPRALCCHSPAPTALQVSRAPALMSHSVHFSLRPRNMHEIYEIADAVSDPS